MQKISAEIPTGLSDPTTNPGLAAETVKKSITALDQNSTGLHRTPHEANSEMLDDVELAAIARERVNEEPIYLTLDDL